MNPVPLSWMLIALGVLVAGNVVTGKMAWHYHQKIGEVRAECNVEALKADNAALKSQVTAYETAVTEMARVARAAQERDAVSAKLAATYRRQLNDARKEEPALDTALSERTRERLRQYEADYQAGAVHSGAAEPAGAPLR